MAELNTTSLPLAHTAGAFPDHNNSSAFPGNDDFEAILFFLGFFILINSGIGGLVGNAIVIWFLGFVIKRTPITTYILNLAVADFATLLSLVIFIVVSFLEADLFSLLFTFFLSLSSASVYLLTVISVERCLSIVYPLWYRCHRVSYQSALVCLLIWAISCALGAIRLLLYQTHIVNLIVCVISALICVPTVLICTVILFIKVYCSLHRPNRGRFYTVLLMALLCFLVFGIPLNFAMCVVEYDIEIGFGMVVITILLCAVNSSINPLIYFLCGRKKARHSKESFKQVLQRAFNDKADSGQNHNSAVI